MVHIKCFNCSKVLELNPPISRSEECNCGNDVRCCKNCKFYDERSHQQCIESQADKVSEKERGNFCGYFTPQKANESGQTRPQEIPSESGLAGELQAFLKNKPKDPFSK